jgi:D-alanyl-D-alanine endopeptidase (penicillin-binding protein 7)
MRLISVVTALCLVHALPAQADDLPNVKSASAVVLDVGTGAEVYGKDPDAVRAIASTTKLFVALAVRKKGIVLDDWTEITNDDVKAAKGGSKTRLDRGQTFKNHDLLRAMLMASDNRAPTALGRAVGLDRQGLIDEMNAVAKDLGLTHTKFTDTAGLRGNVSTAREMALAMRAVLDDPVLAEILRTDYVVIESKSKYAKLTYGTTDQALVAKKHKVLGGKTGYTHKAGYCFVGGIEADSRDYVIAILGGEAKSTRFADFDRVADWVEAGSPGGKVKPKKKGSKKAAKLAAEGGDDGLRVHASGRTKK